ncbi:CKLF-like MARVEL transmembrane domain-containing protein 6 [Parambassis ranga]|uniref:CKLF-like MARVEL transmembrane domain-containing protein 6 n=1 Tax=Parambassis ranga TaxID=210632 RepID=A0A6P7HRU0_9TELE|nr:CKLF-like MARVEL transmembrane domain-containing protein 4 [Parambassis ranga]
MAMSEVYSPTTAPNPKSSWCVVPSQYLDKIRFAIKVSEVLLSFLAFVLEEAVNTCTNCAALYFFEFVSCTAFLFTLLLLILLSTTLHTKVGITCWPKLDLIYTAIIALLFLISSISFASQNSGSNLESTAVAFGFLAMLAFAVDLFFLWRNQGPSFKGDSKPETSNGGSVEVEDPAEKERLRDGVANGAE